jgi:hypothetical protein
MSQSCCGRTRHRNGLPRAEERPIGSASSRAASTSRPSSRASACRSSPITRSGGTNSTRCSASTPVVGSYVVTGTDSDGKRYASPGIVGIALAPSGAFEVEWDNGKQVGVGESIGNVLAVACLTKGRTAILLMTINPDGSLSGKWSRRTDRGYKGTETWKRAD